NIIFFFFSSRRRHTRFSRDWSSDVCSSDLRYKDLERNYRAMIRRMRAGDPELAELWHGLGQVYRKHLRRRDEAIESFEVASALRSEERRVGKERRHRWPVLCESNQKHIDVT